MQSSPPFFLDASGRRKSASVLLGSCFGFKLMLMVSVGDPGAFISLVVSLETSLDASPTFPAWEEFSLLDDSSLGAAAWLFLSYL